MTTRRLAISVLGIGLSEANRHEEALVVKEAELSMLRRLGVPEHNILIAQNNLLRPRNATATEDFCPGVTRRS